MILPNDYDLAIHMSQEDRRQKLDRARYHVDFLLALEFSFWCSVYLLTLPFCIGEGLGGSKKGRGLQLHRSTPGLGSSDGGLGSRKEQSYNS